MSGNVRIVFLMTPSTVFSSSVDSSRTAVPNCDERYASLGGGMLSSAVFRSAGATEKIVSKYWSACSYNREVTTARPLPSGETCSATLLDKHACSISVHTSATRPSAVSYAEYSPSR